MGNEQCCNAVEPLLPIVDGESPGPIHMSGPGGKGRRPAALADIERFYLKTQRLLESEIPDDVSYSKSYTDGNS